MLVTQPMNGIVRARMATMGTGNLHDKLTLFHIPEDRNHVLGEWEMSWMRLVTLYWDLLRSLSVLGASLLRLPIYASRLPSLLGSSNTLFSVSYAFVPFCSVCATAVTTNDDDYDDDHNSTRWCARRVAAK